MHSKILVIVFLTLVCISILASYYKYVYLADYILVLNVPCIEGNSCFAPECTSEESECIDDYYRGGAYLVVNVVASQVKECSPDDSSCIYNKCLMDDKLCTIKACNSKLGESCIEF